MKHYKELNALRNKISDGRSTRDSIAQFGSNLPGDQLVLWDTYNADLPRATFEEYVKEQVK